MDRCCDVHIILSKQSVCGECYGNLEKNLPTPNTYFLLE